MFVLMKLAGLKLFLTRNECLLCEIGKGEVFGRAPLAM